MSRFWKLFALNLTTVFNLAAAFWYRENERALALHLLLAGVCAAFNMMSAYLDGRIDERKR